MSGSKGLALPARMTESSEKLADRVRITREELAWVKREMEEARDRIGFARMAQWEYALRRRGHDESAPGHAAKTLGVVGVVELVKRREQKAVKKLSEEKRRLEAQLEEERRRLKEVREQEKRQEREAEAEREKRERRNGRRRERYAERKVGPAAERKKGRGRGRGGDREPERDPV